MTILDIMNQYMATLTLVIFLICIAAVGSMIYIKKRKKQRATKEYHTDYEKMERKDITSYVKFDDILSVNDGEGILVLDNWKKFVTGISTIGNDFYHKDSGEQLMIMGAMESFISTIQQPMQVTQSARLMNLDSTYERFNERRTAFIEELASTTQEFEELRKKAEDVSNEEYNEYYYPSLQRMKHKIQSLNWMQKSLESTLKLISSFSGEDSVPVKEISYFYDWSYGASMHTVELDEKEREKKAIAELDEKSGRVISALRKAEVYGERYSAEELIDYMWRHFHPYSSKKQTVADVTNRIYAPFISTSESMEEQASMVLEDLESGYLNPDVDYRPEKAAEFLRKESVTGDIESTEEPDSKEGENE